MQQPIILSVAFNCPKEVVWKAITNVNQMKQWYFPQLTDFTPREGFETEFSLAVEDRVFVHQWKVTEVTPVDRIAYQWQFGGLSGKGVSTFQLTELNNITTLHLNFTVLEPFPEHIPEFKRESGVEGWNYLIKESLKNFLSNI